MSEDEHVYFFLQGEGDNSDQELVREFRMAVYNLKKKDRQDLDYAIQHVPDLVEMESNPMKFLKRENFDFEAAAKRLAAYWKYRKDYFEDRAFLPMSIQGPVRAMSNDDIDFLRKGTHTILPDTPKGKAVVFFDRAAQSKDAGLTPGVRKRCFFYITQVTSEKEEAATEGYTALVNMESIPIQYEPVSQEIASCFDKAFPIVSRSHVFWSPSSKFSFHGVLARFVAIAYQTCGLEVAGKIKLHLTKSSEDSLAKLLSLGFEEEHVPEVLGGRWEHEDWLVWMEKRVHEENLRYASDNPQQRVLTVHESPESRSRQGSLPVVSLSRSAQQAQPQSQRNLLLQHQGQELSGPNDSASLPPQRGFPLPPGIPNPSSVAAALPPVHSAAVHLDEYERRGISSHYGEESKSTLERAIETFHEALSLIHKDEKKAYLEALKKAPQLVKSESDPVKFIRIEDYDSWSAARRFVMYWDHRKKLFGERAFLPLTQTEGGALTNDDLMGCQTGLCAVLPRDAAGRQVLAFDRGRSLKGGKNTDDSELRAMFYIVSVLSEDERNTREGFVIISFVVSPHRMDDFLPSHLRRLIEFHHCMPVKVKATHMIVNPPKSTKRSALVDTIVATAMEAVKVTVKEQAILHTGESNKEILEKLKVFGLSEEGLPHLAGGSWKYENFKQWLQDRAGLEAATERQDQAQEVHAQDPSTAQPVPRAAAPAAALTDSSAPASGKDEDALCRKRKMNVIHSRQKRERRKAEEVALQQKHASLVTENHELKRENQYLEGIMADVLSKLAPLHP